MAIEKPGRRLPLRDLVTDAEKRTRNLLDKLGTAWIRGITDLRERSRPVRRRSPFPTSIDLQNTLDEVLTIQDEMAELIESLLHSFDEIGDQARREGVNRP